MILDEAAFFGLDEESKIKNDAQLVQALKPALATTGGKLIAISSPYASKGWCYSQYKRYHGNDNGKTLIWNCPSRTMNPTLPQEVVDDAMAEDPVAARAEFLGEFRDDVSTFLPRDLIENFVIKGRTELAPNSAAKYSAFVDLSGGRVDDAAMAIAHKNEGKIILDYLRRWRPPFSPDKVVGEMVDELHRYGIRRCVGDNYSAEFTKQSFESRGIRYARATTNVWSKNPMNKTAKPKSQLYIEMLPRLCSGEIELLDIELLISQIAGLERRTRSGGRDVIDHPPGGHDDIANVCAGVVDAVSQRKRVLSAYGDSASGDDFMTRFRRKAERENQEYQEQQRKDDERRRREQRCPAELRTAMFLAGRLSIEDL